MDKKTNKVIRRNAVQDYVYRGYALKDLSLYQFVTHFGQETRGRRARLTEHESRKQGYVRALFLKGHPLEATHLMCERMKPVPICANFPSTKTEDNAKKEKPAKMLLLYLKPWRVLEDLKSPQQSWWEALEAFKAIDSDEVREVQLIMDNIQEIKDIEELSKEERKEELAQDGPSARNREQLEREYEERRFEYEDNGEYREAIKLLKSGKAFEKPTGRTTKAHGVDDGFTDLANERLNAQCFRLAEKSRDYLQRENEVVKQARQNSSTSKARQPPTRSGNGQSSHSLGNSSTACPQSPEELGLQTFAKIRQLKTLNRKQTAAFYTCVEAALKRITEGPLYEAQRILITGVGSNGKSKMIEAITTWYDAMNKGHELVTVAPTGTAVAQVNGSTIHSVHLRPWSHVATHPCLTKRNHGRVTCSESGSARQGNETEVSCPAAL
ncbi:hypothetical protein PTMSG1_05897 [Pyrenophora teres f. maculata]|nr:hypothetical protein PTMSG1_05897 [Pyrenophora teres f. maculata]